jgi:hypothetical protein
MESATSKTAKFNAIYAEIAGIAFQTLTGGKHRIPSVQISLNGFREFIGSF